MRILNPEEQKKPKEIEMFLEDHDIQSKPVEVVPTGKPLHYYGDLVRRIFLLGAVIMAVCLPFVTDLLKLPMWESIIAITVLGLFAGLTTPRQKWVQAADLVLAMIGFLYFEYYGIKSFRSEFLGAFMVNQVLAVVFLVAMYYSTKSFRRLTYDISDVP